MGAGAAADSRALQADALDFLGDAANYAVSLAVVGAALAWRARAALVKFDVHARLCSLGVGSAVLAFVNGTAPDPAMMGAIGALALAPMSGSRCCSIATAPAMRICARSGSARVTTPSAMSR